jgi:hypothetical protein
MSISLHYFDYFINFIYQAEFYDIFRIYSIIISSLLISYLHSLFYAFMYTPPPPYIYTLLYLFQQFSYKKQTYTQKGSVSVKILRKQ